MEALLADALDQQHLAALVADQVDHDAAQRRAGSAHGGVQQEAFGVGIGVAGHDGVQRHAQKSRVHRGKSHHPPDPQRLQHRQNQQAPFVEQVFHAGLLILRERPVLTGCRVLEGAHL